MNTKKQRYIFLSILSITAMAGTQLGAMIDEWSEIPSIETEFHKHQDPLLHKHQDPLLNSEVADCASQIQGIESEEEFSDEFTQNESSEQNSYADCAAEHKDSEGSLPF